MDKGDQRKMWIEAFESKNGKLYCARTQQGMGTCTKDDDDHLQNIWGMLQDNDQPLQFNHLFRDGKKCCIWV